MKRVPATALVWGRRSDPGGMRTGHAGSRRRRFAPRGLIFFLTALLVLQPVLQAAPVRGAELLAVRMPPQLLRYDPAYTSNAQRDALLALEAEAIDKVLEAHGLPASDREAVQSWARNDALAMLWGLLVHAGRVSGHHVGDLLPGEPRAGRRGDVQRSGHLARRRRESHL